MEIKFVDIFAGPGGLGEGFTQYANLYPQGLKFRAVKSIEKDPIAVKTLTLRTWLHLQPEGSLPEIYEDFVNERVDWEHITKTSEWEQASKIVWNAELGKIPEIELHSNIKKAINGTKNWVLLGGPPCQAYSIMGRSRMTGVGAINDGEVSEEELRLIRNKKSSDFYADHRHALYKEYLRIVALHQPAVFVMENVKGILSSKVGAGKNMKRIFPIIRKDLQSPHEALRTDESFQKMRRFHSKRPKCYRLYSFVTGEENPQDKEFTIRSENYGVPQKRHRVIILGVREDIKGAPNPLTPQKSLNVRGAIEDLPSLRSGLSKEADNPASWVNAIATNFPKDAQIQLGAVGKEKRLHKILKRKSSNLVRKSKKHSDTLSEENSIFAKWITTRAPSIVLQHETRGHMSSDLSRYLYAALFTEATGVTPKLKDWPIDLLPAHKNIRLNRSGVVEVKGFQDRFRVQGWEVPATTITSHISKDGHYYIHPSPEQCRSLTVREAARLQTFPDNYFFCGNRTQQYHQVGNAVPPLLAVQLADVVANLLNSTLPIKEVKR